MIRKGVANVVAGRCCQTAERLDGPVGGDEDSFERCQAHHAVVSKTWVARPCGSVSVRSLRIDAWKDAMKKTADVEAFAKVVVHVFALVSAFWKIVKFREQLVVNSSTRCA